MDFSTGAKNMASTSLNIQLLLEKLRSEFSDIVAFRIKRDGSYVELTGQQVVDRAEIIGAHLQSLGLKTGDRVALLSENRPEWGVSYLAIVCHGFIAVPLDRLLKPLEIRNILEDSGSRAAVLSDDFLSDVEAIASELPELTHVLRMDHLMTVEKAEASAGLSESQPDDLAALIYTSGTTGNPKGVMLSHRNIMSNVAACRNAISFSRGDNFLSVLPLHHTFECTAGFLAPLYGGASVTYVGSLKSRDIIDTMKETSATIMLGVPLLYEKMYAGIMRAVRSKPAKVQKIFNMSMGVVKAAEKLGLHLGGKVFHGLREKGGFGTIRFFVSGAAALPVEVNEGFQRLGLRILQGYGLTETSPVVSVNRFDAPKSDSVGQPLAGVDVKIVNPDETGVGEIIVSGDNIMRGYYRNQEATDEILKDGWLYTGDSGWVDKDGHLYIAGRIKNVIVTRAGKNIYPEEVEGEIAQSPWVGEVLVLADVDESSGDESVKAIVVPDYEYLDEEAKASGNSLSDEEIAAIIKEEVKTRCTNLADYKRPKTVEIRKEEFPKTSTRKIKRYLLNKQEPPESSFS